MKNYNFLVLGFVVAAVLLVPGIDESWADWSFEGFIGEAWSCPGSNWSDTPNYSSGYCWFNSVQDVAVDQSNNIYVATFYPQKIYKLNSAGNNVQEYSLPDKAREVDVDGAGNVYVSLGQFSQTTIVKYDSSGNLLSESNGYSGNIVDFAVDDAGDIYIIYGTNELRKFESDPCCGSGSGHNLIFNKSYQGDRINEIEVDQRTGKVYLGLGPTLKILDSSGNELTPAGGIIPTGGTITGIDVDSAGNIYISDNNVGLQKFDSSASPGSGQGTSSTISPTASAPFDLTSYSTISPGSEFAVNGAGDVYANGGHAVLKFSHVEPVQGSFTVNYFEIFEESGHTRFKVGGDMPEPFVYRSMTYLITDSNGDIVYDYPSYTTANGEGYGLDAPVFWKVTSYNQGNPTGGEYIQEYGDDFTLKICAPEIDQCMEKEFTISKMSGPFTITDDSTGGDCSTIGDWSSATKTCTLSNDLDGPIIIGSNDITLDGNAKSINGTYTSLNPSTSAFTEGVKMDGVTGVTVKNIIINNVNSGIYLSSSENNVIQDNTLTNNGYGVNLYNSPSNTITSNTINSDDGDGIKVDRSHLTVITNNVQSGASNG
ncbi:MAG: hypothetical protein HOB51_08440, partial [Thaumarchaeota archaeon]|nr:hypothetical protein [Nitrososphaerota archaeon]